MKDGNRILLCFPGTAFERADRAHEPHVTIYPLSQRSDVHQAILRRQGRRAQKGVLRVQFRKSLNKSEWGLAFHGNSSQSGQPGDNRRSERIETLAEKGEGGLGRPRRMKRPRMKRPGRP